MLILTGFIGVFGLSVFTDESHMADISNAGELSVPIDCICVDSGPSGVSVKAYPEFV